jgi:hypothetical protein
MIEAFEARLRERRDQIEAMGLAERVPAALAQLREQRLAYAGRLAALGRSRPMRIAAVARLLRDGRYRQFHGVRSAIKDLIT